MTDVKVNLRMIVLDILMEVEKGQLSHVVLGNALKKYQYLDKSDRSFISRLTLGVLERRIELDYIINAYSKTPTAKMKPAIRNILRMGVYQIKYMDKVPVSAACNEAVRLADKKGFHTLKGFVNGVLRNVARTIDDIGYPDRTANLRDYLSVKYSCPSWIVDMWAREYGAQRTESMLEAISGDKATYIRCNLSKITTDELIKVLTDEGVSAVRAVDVIKSDRLTIPEYAVIISGYDYLEALDSFKDGLFWVQDISSMLAVTADCVKSGDRCIDVCAAPGGKAMNAAVIARDGAVDARDISTTKTDMIESNIYRLGLTNITTRVWDATVPDESAFAAYDVVIADLPCSGLGIMGRKPDIRYNASPEGIKALAQLQRDILMNAAEYVKPGGLLIYSTCTVSSEENERNVEWLTEHFPYEKIEENVQIVPGELGSDGFFIARLRRRQ